MPRILAALLAALCLTFGCAPSESGSPAEPDNTTAQASPSESVAVTDQV